MFYTRASLSEPNKLFSYLPSSITIAPGRPRFASILSSIIDRSCALFTPAGIEGRISDRLSGVVVGVCGPDGFGNEVRKAVGGVDPRRYKAVGGIEMSEESVNLPYLLVRIDLTGFIGFSAGDPINYYPGGGNFCILHFHWTSYPIVYLTPVNFYRFLYGFFVLGNTFYGVKQCVVLQEELRDDST